jgi:hypothetical protein
MFRPVVFINHLHNAPYRVKYTYYSILYLFQHVSVLKKNHLQEVYKIRVSDVRKT